MKKTSLILLLFLIPFRVFASEEIPDECKRFVEPEAVPPKIIINEISFKDDPDWIEFFVLDDRNQGKGANLRGFSIHDDSIIKKFSNLTVKTNEFFTLTFNSEKSDSNSEQFTEQTGLTGTTEQLILKSDYDQILDIVCWTTESPPQTELSDLKKLNKNISECIKSPQVANNASIGLLKNEWIIFKHPTKGTENELKNAPPIAIIGLQSAETSGKAPFKQDVTAEDSYDPDHDEITFKWDFGDDSISEKENPKTHTYLKTGKYEIILEVTDTLGAKGENSLEIEVISDEPEEEPKLENYPKILINEVMPNPEGADTGMEWIELKNPNSFEVDLKNWQIDDSPDGSKPFKFTDHVIAGAGYLIIESKESKLNLNNTEDQVRLFDPNGLIRDELYYEDAKSGQSLARNGESIWYWSSAPSKGKPNIEIIDIEETESEKENEEIEIFENGDNTDGLEITEVLPNPDGTDTGQEWIEIHNNSEEDINPGNWQLDDSEGSSKPFIFSDSETIKKGEYLVISSKDSKINLGNTRDEVRLFSPDKILRSKIEYTNAPSSMSYAKIEIIKDGRLLATLTPPDEQEKWEWTSEVTKGKENPKYELLQIKVQNTDDIDKTRSFQALLGDKPVEIIFADDILDPKIAKITITNKSILVIEARKLADDVYQLRSYRLKEAEPDIDDASQQKYSIPIILATLLLITGISLSAFYLYKRYWLERTKELGYN